MVQARMERQTHCPPEDGGLEHHIGVRKQEPVPRRCLRPLPQGVALPQPSRGKCLHAEHVQARGLTGELRSVAHPDRRLAEAAKFGLRRVVSPEGSPTLRAAVRAALGAVRVAA